MTEYLYITRLLKGILDNNETEELPDGATFEGVYKKSRFHHLSAMVFYAIEKLKNKPDERLYKLWRQDRDKAIARDFKQLHEYNILEQTFVANEISYIPLKGIILKELYPSPDMRYMCDIDVITKENTHIKIKKLMLDNGYEIEHYQVGNHDSYTKKPVMNIEIHRFLFSDFTFGGKHFAKYFKNPFDLTKDNEGYKRELCETYFFLHLLTHAAKHYLNGGIGLRAFMDIWLYYKNNRDNIDLKRIGDILSDSNYKELCFDFVTLSQMWFGDMPYDKKYDQMSEYIFKGGAFGTIESNVNNEIKEQGKAKYIFSTLFPSCKKLAFSYPILNKAPVLYPFCLILRLLTKPIVNFKKNFAKLKAILKFKK